MKNFDFGEKNAPPPNERDAYSKPLKFKKNGEMDLSGLHNMEG